MSAILGTAERISSASLIKSFDVVRIKRGRRGERGAWEGEGGECRRPAMSTAISDSDGTFHTFAINRIRSIRFGSYIASAAAAGVG